MTARQSGHQHPAATGIVDYAGYGLLHLAVDRLGISEAQLLRALKAQEKHAAVDRKTAAARAVREQAEQQRKDREAKQFFRERLRQEAYEKRAEQTTREESVAFEQYETAREVARSIARDRERAEVKRWAPNEFKVPAGQLSQRIEDYGRHGLEGGKDAAEYYIENAVGGVVGKGVFKGVRRLMKTRAFTRLKGPLLRLSEKAFKNLNGGPAAYPVPDYYHGTRFGKWQIARTGSTMEYRVTSRGRTLQIDGLAPSKLSPEKVDIIEAKFSNPDFDDITKSGHVRFWDSKEDQLRRLAQYAKDNKNSIGQVRVVVNKRDLGEIYRTLIEHLDDDLKPFVDVDVFL